ncbi:MAG TPA: hypothetical protein VH165_22070 [Kofleriaceae bacterium]|nr:hypothetical protein [Kofleriaceae bacterium]
MKLLPDLSLPDAAATQLVIYQAEVDHGTFAERVARGKRLFKSRNRKGNTTFDSVKNRLTEMCSGARRCAYCEDSAADEVEHVYPKHFYPDRVFVWRNYIYACGPCNSPKGSRFAGYPAGAGSQVELSQPAHTLSPPPAGVPGLLDPRVENGTEFLALELRDTFYFVACAPAGTLEYERARYTIDVLGLNKREILPRARRAAYQDYCAHLRQYIAVHREGGDTAELTRLKLEILTRQHPTVWFEMKRQHASLPALATMFAEVPEALSW